MAQSSAPLTFLEHSPLFDGCPDPDLRALARVAQIRELPARQALFWQGEAGRDLFVVREGAFRLTRQGPGSRPQVIGFAGPGDLLGESALLTGHGYAFTAVAERDSEVVALDGERIARLLEARPWLGRNLLSLIAARVEALCERVTWLGGLSADRRVAAYLLEAGTEPGDGAGHRQTDVASLLGLAPETLSRILGDFKRRGWIEARNGAVSVVDRRALAGVLEGRARA